MSKKVKNIKNIENTHVRRKNFKRLTNKKDENIKTTYFLHSPKALV